MCCVAGTQYSREGDRGPVPGGRDSIWERESVIEVPEVRIYVSCSLKIVLKWRNCIIHVPPLAPT